MLPLTAHAEPVTGIQVGQAFWRPQATITTQKLPNGSTRQVPADLYGLALEQPTPVRVRFYTEGRLGVVIKSLGDADAQGDPRTVAVIGAGKPFEGTFAAGRYLFIVASDQPDDGAYLLSVARPPKAQGQLERLALPGPEGAKLPFLGRFGLGHKLTGLELSPDGRWLAAWDANAAWLADLESCAVYLLPHLKGSVARVALAPDGWSVMVVTEGGAALVTLPDLTPFVQFISPSGVRDAVYAGPHQRVAVLPKDGNVYVSSPVEGDMAYLPGTKGGLALLGESSGSGLGVRFPGDEVGVFDLTARKVVGRGKWPGTPTELALQPGVAILAGVGPKANALWKAGPVPRAEELPAAVSLSWAPNGDLALATDKGVVVRKDEQTIPIEPAFVAQHVAFNAPGHRLVAATDAGEVVLWNTLSLLERKVQGDPVSVARLAYTDGLSRLKNKDYAGAHLSFGQALQVLKQQEPKGDILEIMSVTLLRLSQCSYATAAYEQSLAEAEEMLAVTAKLPEGELRKANEAQGLYRKADALWSLGRKDEARTFYQQALDHGLGGGAAADAREKVGR